MIIGIYGYQNRRRFYSDEAEMLNPFDRTMRVYAHRQMLKMFKRLGGD